MEAAVEGVGREGQGDKGADGEQQRPERRWG